MLIHISQLKSTPNSPFFQFHFFLDICTSKNFPSFHCRFCRMCWASDFLFQERGFVFWGILLWLVKLEIRVLLQNWSRDRVDLGFVWSWMGNKLGRRRQLVDEKYTRPQGLYQHKDVDHKKLRKLILDSKLAPCYPGDDDCSCDLEECPICFLVCGSVLLKFTGVFVSISSFWYVYFHFWTIFQYYPSLNRSRCCTKGICTGKYHVIVAFKVTLFENNTIISLTFLLFNQNVSYRWRPQIPHALRSILISCSIIIIVFFLLFQIIYISCFQFLTIPRCPFCKTLNYAVEYRGVKTKEEKGQEQIVSTRLS